MALSQAQWYAKLRKFVPSWWFEEDDQAVCYAVALFEAMAAFWHQLQLDGDDAFNASFLIGNDPINGNQTPYLDLRGQEVGKSRLGTDTNLTYAARIQEIFGTSFYANLQAQVNACLNNGTAYFILNEQYGFFDDAMFCDDTVSRLLDGMKNYNWFTIIVPIQTAGVQADIMAEIVTVLEENIALGTTYDILYRSTSDTDAAD